MVIITQKCKIDECNGLGSLDNNGKRYLKKGYCEKHYRRLQRGYDIEVITVYDKRHAIIEDNIAKIPLGINAKNGYAIVDKEFSYLDKYYWYCSNGYAINNKLERMHHKIIGKPKIGFEVDHKNRDRLDNRLCNLRFVTSQQNSMNVSTHRDNVAGYKGVFKNHYKWSARIKVNSKQIRLGEYATTKEAALAYNKAAIEYFGEYSCLNNINQLNGDSNS